MKFRKNKAEANPHELPHKDALRKKIWNSKSIIARLFSDKEWKKFDDSQILTPLPSAEMLNNIYSAIKETELAQEQKAYRKQRSIKIWGYSGTAAAMVILFLSFSLWQWKTPIDSELVKMQQKHRPSAIADTVWATITNTTSRTQTLRLPDNSSVKLFAHSTIRYPEKFTTKAREIYLDGKAYFSVKKDASRPFSVFAGGTKTTALGTSFTIDTRVLHKTNVKLHTGKIVIASTSLTPSFTKVYLGTIGESLSFNSRTHTIERTKVLVKQIDQSKPTKTSLLDMNNIPLTEVFSQLAQAYHTKISIGSSSIANIQYTGSINIDSESLTDALAVICLINDLRYVVAANGTYTIYIQEQNQTNKK